jgi:hypothetical protein
MADQEEETPRYMNDKNINFDFNVELQANELEEP